VACEVAVTRLRVAGGRCVGVDTAAGPREAGAVVLAAGAWCGALAASVGLRRPLIPLRRTVSRLVVQPSTTSDVAWVWIDDVGLWGRAADGGWWVSGCDERVDRPPEGPSAGPVDPEVAARAMAKVARHLPALAGARWDGGWSGLRTFAPDRRPLAGPDDELPGLAWAAGLGGSGITTAPAVAEIVTAGFTGADPPWFRSWPRIAPARESMRRWTIRPDGDATGARFVEDSEDSAPRSGTIRV
jgi:D-arginine dehydrogenase